MRKGDSNLLGRWGEARVADYLREEGYHILAFGWRCRFGEIDLIAENEEYLAFVEVKLRKNARFAQGREAVGFHKQQRIYATAQLYLVQNPTLLQPRFDVVEVYAPQGIETERPEIIYLENAFSEY